MKFIILVSLFSSFSLFGQIPPNILISTLNNPEEVCIAINPKNTNQIVAGANIDNGYYSSDGGLTWQHQQITCPPYGVWGDPVVFWDTTNMAYFAHLSNPPPGPGNSAIDRIVVQKSTNYGQTWSQNYAFGLNGSKKQDKPWVCVNKNDNGIHVCWTQFDHYGTSNPLDTSLILYSNSMNGGVTWSTPKRISKFGGDCVDMDNTVEGAVPAIGPNNEIFVSWASAQGLMFQKSLDNGVTWLPQEQFITTIPGGWDYMVNGLDRCNGLPFTFCDLSGGPNHGTIYINWTDQRNGINDGDVWLIKSNDGGNTWSVPIRVNNDVPGKQQFLTNMAIDQTNGNLYCVFYDRRNFIGNNTDVYIAASNNGGNTFSNFKINQNAFKPNSNYFFGDYIGISAHNNMVRPIWMQMDTVGHLSVYTAIINGSDLITKTRETNKINLGNLNSFPNPFNDKTVVEFTPSRDMVLTIDLIDNKGILVNRVSKDILYKSSTKASVQISKERYGLKQGIYYLVFYSGDNSQYIKLIVD